MATIGLKVPVTAPLTKCVAALRPSVSFAISALKTSILEGAYIYTCNYIDTDGIGIAIRIYEALSQNDIQASCYEHDRPCSIDFFRNLYEAQTDTIREIEDEDRML